MPPVADLLSKVYYLPDNLPIVNRSFGGIKPSDECQTLTYSSILEKFEQSSSA